MNESTTFKTEMKKTLTRPHRLALMLVMFLTVAAGLVMIAEGQAKFVFELGMETSVWLLGVIVLGVGAKGVAVGVSEAGKGVARAVRK